MFRWNLKEEKPMELLEETAPEKLFYLRQS